MLPMLSLAIDTIAVCGCGHATQRHHDMERAAHTRLAFNPYFTTVGFNDLSADGQPQSGPFGLAIAAPGRQGMELLENTFEVRRGDANAVVRDGQGKGLVLNAGVDVHPAAVI